MKRNKVVLFLLVVGILFLTRGLAYRLMPLIEISGKSPWGVVGPLSKIGISPITNYLRFALFLFIPLSISAAFFFLINRKNQFEIFLKENYIRKHKPLISFSILTILVVFAFGFSSMIWAPHVQYDAFHEGETLGPAALIRLGQTPYSEFVFCHGLFQDPYRSTFSFFLFGESVSASRFVESGLRIISLFLLAYLIYLLFNKAIAATIFILIFLFSLNSRFLPNAVLNFFDWNPISIMNVSRDALVSLYLVVAFLIKQKIRTKTPSGFLIFSFSLIPFLSLGYSVDRGFYLLTAHFFIGLPAILFVSDKAAKFRVGLLSGLGILNGLFILFIALQFQWSAFFEYVFATMPKYKEWMDGYLYKFDKFKYQNIALLFSLGTILFTIYLYCYSKLKLRGIINSVWFELVFFSLSVFLFRNALGRSDWSHVMYSTGFMLLFLIYMIDKIWIPRVESRFFNYATLFGGLVFGIYTLSLGIRSGSFSQMFDLKKSDQDILPFHYFETKSFLQKQKVEDGGFYPLTSDATWFYVLGLRCPNRFPSMWFAAPDFYQREVINGLKENKTKFILYKNINDSGVFDGITNEERAPIIMNYIHSNYAPDTVVSGNEIWRICYD